MALEIDCGSSYLEIAMPASCRFAMAVHALAYLGMGKDKCATSQQISLSTNANPVVVRRIMSALQSARLISTQKGPNGGARLLRPPGEISLAEIYRAVQTTEAFSLHHTLPNPECPVGARIQDVLENVFEAAQVALEGELEKTSLRDILREVGHEGSTPSGAGLHPEGGVTTRS